MNVFTQHSTFPRYRLDLWYGFVFLCQRRVRQFSKSWTIHEWMKMTRTDTAGQTMSDVILQNITLDCFLPVYVRPLPGIAFPSFLRLSYIPVSRGEESCERRFGERSLPASTAARRRQRPSLRGGLHPRRPSVRRSPVVLPCPKTHSLLCSLCGDNDDAVADKIRLLAYALHAGLFRIQKEGRDEMKRNSSRW